MITHNKRIIITTGKPAGIGPDIIIMSAQKTWPIELIICKDKNLLIKRAIQLQLPLKLNTYHKHLKFKLHKPKELTVLHIPTMNTVKKNEELNLNNSKYVLKILKRTCIGCLNKEFSAMVNGRPIHKWIINNAKITFIRHTEFLQKYNKNKKIVMMLLSKKLKIALATTHILINKVSKTITSKLLNELILILINNLKKYFNIKQPKIYVCKLNSHAGENDSIRKEEINIIIPTLKILRSKGYKAIGLSLLADAIFQEKYLKNADAILAMYHDQGLLAILKYIGFGKSINTTLGLPLFIQTSIHHGTTITLASSEKNNITKSMNMVIKLAINMMKFS